MYRQKRQHCCWLSNTMLHCCRMYTHEHSTLIVMQDIYATVQHGKQTNELFSLFSDVLSGKLEQPIWEYLMLQYVMYKAHTSTGTFGLKDLRKVFHLLFPNSPDGDISFLLKRYRGTGSVRYVSWAVLLFSKRNAFFWDTLMLNTLIIMIQNECFLG